MRNSFYAGSQANDLRHVDHFGRHFTKSSENGAPHKRSACVAWALRLLRALFQEDALSGRTVEFNMMC